MIKLNLDKQNKSIPMTASQSQDGAKPQGEIMAEKAKKVVEAKPAETKTPAQTATVTPKKSNTALIVVIVLIVLLGLPAIGFGAFWYFVGRKVDNFTDKLNNGEVNLSLGEDANLNTTKNQSWPTNLPVSVPEFSAGDIVSSGNLENVWSIIIEGATKADVLSYQKSLTAAGWTTEGENIELEGMVSVSATKNNYGLNITLSTDEDGKTSLLYTLGENTDLE